MTLVDEEVEEDDLDDGVGSKDAKVCTLAGLQFDSEVDGWQTTEQSTFVLELEVIRFLSSEIESAGVQTMLGGSCTGAP